ncbi:MULTISPECIES: DEAD/DEAH box helicase [Halomonas]|uniref:DEAD/DEAH box helicase n=1 Tax=Halomonas TaxID=2745 RepID=UPI001C941EE9|nr:MULTISPECIES: DEAD/DEAH box helicase [Halomonas]MBY6208367.1 DEAD/DEAH box helicase [Halomonas sp. DP3Y7-2]MBY6229176.1 DEAD/DEAH box helicase [Halomonas sp. DP3Y7-1]MCA0916841.1 DEAD/DEAH box helicase [Halomonas denitrificans]
MNITEIAEDAEPINGISELLDTLHKEGPVSSAILEKIAYYKKFHSDAFQENEEKIITSLGLFYKLPESNNLYSFLLSGIGKQHKEEFGEYLTPVQASVRRAVNENKIVSISAPTSAGKSYSIRDFIAEEDGDVVVIVPSRALIAEYVHTMKQKFNGDKNVMISTFVDVIFKSRNPRRIFILTPERGRDLFSMNLNLNIKAFFFDEAQVSEEGERGVIFDVLVRRVKTHFEAAKLIFAHPFVENPEAQLKKHNVPEVDGYSRSYTHGSVGKIFIYQHKNKKYYYFSPFIERGHQIKKCVEHEQRFSDFAFDGTHSVLVYVSKASIYNGKYIEPFRKYIDSYVNVDSPEAEEIINTIEHLLGADNDEHNSELVALLRKGIVIHHGSVPLEVRFLVEDLIRKGHAKICFATSTLAQGVNMPFDIVWLDNMRILGDSEQSRSLSFKNLIGRAGRLSKKPKFDFGYVFTKNPQLLSQRVNEKFLLDEQSIIDNPEDIDDPDTLELINSIEEGNFDDDKQASLSKVERLAESEILQYCEAILSIIYNEGSIKDNLYGAKNERKRESLKRYFRYIYEASINRFLYDGELAVFRQAISIFLQVIQGRSFREIVGIRYSYISKKDEGRQGYAAFSQPASKLPKSTLRQAYSIFEANTLAKNVSYDAVVFDTYDYLDQVISFSLTECFITSFKVYKDQTSDQRSDKMIELLRFGTNNTVHTLLMRYGFPPEDISEISKYILYINEDTITFKSNMSDAPEYIREMVDWYLPG